VAWERERGRGGPGEAKRHGSVSPPAAQRESILSRVRDDWKGAWISRLPFIDKWACCQSDRALCLTSDVLNFAPLLKNCSLGQIEARL